VPRYAWIIAPFRTRQIKAPRQADLFMQRPSFFKRFHDSILSMDKAPFTILAPNVQRNFIMADESDHKSTAVPLIVGVLAALTVGYWVFHGGNNGDQNAATSKPPAATNR
jgi:hypothetical protein